MKLRTQLTLFLATGALASACIVENVDTDNDVEGTGGTQNTGGSGGTGGDAAGGMGGSEGGAGGMGGGEGGAGGGMGGEGGGGPSCFDQCDSMYPDGVTDYLGYLSCVTCSACYDVCDGGTGDVCVSGEEGGCSTNFNDCETCVNSPCAADVDNEGVTSGVCATELDTFLNNEDAVAINDCYNACP